MTDFPTKTTHIVVRLTTLGTFPTIVDLFGNFAFGQQFLLLGIRVVVKFALLHAGRVHHLRANMTLHE